MNSDLNSNVRTMPQIDESSSDSSTERAYKSAFKQKDGPPKMQLGTRFSKIQLPGPKTS